MHVLPPSPAKKKQNKTTSVKIRTSEKVKDRLRRNHKIELERCGAGAAPYARWPPPLVFPMQSRGIAPGIVGIEVQRSLRCSFSSWHQDSVFQSPLRDVCAQLATKGRRRLVPRPGVGKLFKETPTLTKKIRDRLSGVLP